MCDYYDYYQIRQPFGQQFIPGGPPFGIGGPPFGQQFFPPFGQQFTPPSAPGAGQPPGPPPSFTPAQSQAQTLAGPGVLAVDPGAIRPCVRRFVYIWLDNGQQFWAWLVFVGRRSAAGWRWTGFRWVYFGVDLNRIERFLCF